jgi:pimeloyl-ACP methyl ester carboxylesterase
MFLELLRPWWIVLAVVGALSAAQEPGLAAGTGQQTAELAGVPLQVFTWRPDGCAISGILLVFHGLARNAQGYRDDAIPLGRRFCLLVVAPLFDAARFPAWRYQRGGIVHDGTVRPSDTWTVNLVPLLVAWVREREGRPDLPYTLIGHSAGAQFLSRAAAYAPVEATHVVIANPSTWVRTRADVAAPYGFGGFGDTAAAEAALRRYLATNITVLLGQEDVGSRDLATGREAEEQGSTRFARGENAFHEAELEARQHGWTFNWHLAIVPGVGHSARSMFASDQMVAALAR